MSETANANMYTEAQHFALLTSAVERETAALAEVKETLETQVGTLESEKAALAEQLSELRTRLDVTEAEKAAAEARADAAAKEFADFKAELARQAEIAEKKTARIEQVKAANSSLGEGYFSQERAQRWAEMSDEAFAALVADLTEAAATAATTSGGDSASSTTTTTTDGHETARETAAFTGGQSATSTQGESTTARFLGARRRGTAA